MKKSDGFVLLTVLLLIQMYALLGMGALEQVFLEQKLLSAQKHRNRLLFAAESHLRALASSLAEHSALCLISALPAVQLKARPSAWWSTTGCSEKNAFYQVYYVVESLGTDPCAVLPAHTGAASYERLTLFLTPVSDESQKVILQTTVVRAGKTDEHCDTQLHSVDLGPQSWHEL